MGRFNDPIVTAPDRRKFRVIAGGKTDWLAVNRGGQSLRLAVSRK